MLIVHVLGALLGVVLGAHGVVFVHALCFGELVDFGAGEAGEEFFGELVGDGFAWRGRKGGLVCGLVGMGGEERGVEGARGLGDATKSKGN